MEMEVVKGKIYLTQTALLRELFGEEWDRVISERWFRELRKRGMIPHWRVGQRKFLYCPDDVRKALESGKLASPPAARAAATKAAVKAAAAAKAAAVKAAAGKE